MSYAQLSHGVREHLGQRHRFAHCVRVARFAERLALRHGESTARARRAGLLHDLARLYPGQVLIEECERRALAIDDFERAHPIVLHARLGAELARERFGERDLGVLQAIGRHTVGAARMTPLDEIVFLADALEPGRSYPERERLANLAFTDLRAAMGDVLDASMEYLSVRGETIAPQTIAARADYAAQRRPLPA